MTNRPLHIAANGLSILLYPLLIPTYGMLLHFLSFRQILQLSGIYWAISLAGTIFFTLLTPIVVILILIKKQQVSNIYIDNSSERTTPYICTICCFGSWCYFLHTIVHVPSYFYISAIGATVALLITTIINLRWKVSAHLCGFGGLIGGIASYALSMGVIPSFTSVAGLLLTALLLMYARLYLKAHTDLQVIIGFFLGLLCTFIPNVIYSYV